MNAQYTEMPNRQYPFFTKWLYEDRTMQKIASPKELQAELRELMSYCQNSEQLSRKDVATKLQKLADKLGASKEEQTPKYQAATLDEANRAAGGPLGRAYWKWVTAYVNFDPESDEARELGALDTGWVIYGWDSDGWDVSTENHIFLPIGTGMYHGSRETWWVGSPVTLSRKVPAEKAIVSGLAKAVSQIKGLSKTDRIYAFPYHGKKDISQKEIEDPRGSNTTIQEWLKKTGIPTHKQKLYGDT
jgi:hypothetical protein